MNNSIIVLMFSYIIIDAALGQIAFPEHLEVDKKKSNIAGRIPLYAPSRCKQHELLYPGDQANDWICDCAPAAVYHPDSDACFPAFRRGPCQNGYMLVLGPQRILPECIQNTCRVDGQIKINNVCYPLGGSAPCKNANLSYVLGVDPATLQIDCVRLSLSVGPRFDENTDDDLSKVELCARGTKRSIEGKCPAAAT